MNHSECKIISEDFAGPRVTYWRICRRVHKNVEPLESTVGIFGEGMRRGNAWLAFIDDVASRRLEYWMFIGREWDLKSTISAAEDFYFKLWKSV
jgi:hypothetical protein